MKNIFKTSFNFIFLIIPILMLGACAKDVTSAGESTGGGAGGEFIPDDPFADLGDNPPSASLVGTWDLTYEYTEVVGCDEYFKVGTIRSDELIISDDGTCDVLLASICQASDNQVRASFQNTIVIEDGCVYSENYYQALELNSSGELEGTYLMEYEVTEECGYGFTYCAVTATVEGVLDESDGTSGSGTGSETSGGSGTSGTSDGGSESGGESSGTESGGSGTGDETEVSTISVESSQVVKDTFFTVTVDITNNTDSENLLVDVVLQKGILSTGGPASSGPSSLPGSFGRASTLVAKTVTVAVGTTETKTLSFKIPENLSGTYNATLRLKYVDEDEITQIVDTSEIIRNLEIK